MTGDEKTFINKHLYNELRYMLCATASWYIAKNSPNNLPRHFVVYTMDSAFLHARTLFEFFTYIPTGKKTYLRTWKDFDLSTGLESNLYNVWRVPLHHHVMHLESRKGVTNEIDGIHLKDMILQFSAEIVRLWTKFSTELDAELRKHMDEVLENSMQEAEIILPDIKNLLKK